VIDLRGAAVTEAVIIFALGAAAMLAIGGLGWLVWFIAHHIHWS